MRKKKKKKIKLQVTFESDSADLVAYIQDNKEFYETKFMQIIIDDLEGSGLLSLDKEKNYPKSVSYSFFISSHISLGRSQS